MRLLDERELSKLRWRCRRGLLENDLFVERFFAMREGRITVRHAEGLTALMDLADNDLLDLLLRRREPEGALQRDEVIEVLDAMRTPLAGPAAGDPNEGPRRAPTAETNPATTPYPHSRNRHDTV